MTVPAPPVASRVAEGRVVSLDAREGARLKPARKVVIRVSGGR
jgi:beta-lactam-binding protein with PASTA domain